MRHFPEGLCIQATAVVKLLVLIPQTVYYFHSAIF